MRPWSRPASRRYWYVIAALGLLHFTLTGRAQDLINSSSPNQRSDHFGDPLPEGALLRLGTVRLRQQGHGSGVSFSPDGRLLVSTGWEDSIRFWDVETGKLVRRLKVDEDDGTFAAVFSPDGSKLASVSERGFVRLWDVQTGNIISKSLAHVDRTYGERVYGVAFSPDGLTFATAGADKSIRLWDAETGEQLLELPTDESGGDARPVVFSPDGSLLASGDTKGTIQIWNLSEGSEAKTIPKAHQRDIASLAFTKDGKYLISGGIRFERTGERSVRSISQIHVWDVTTHEKQTCFSADEELEGNCSFAMSNDGRYLISGHYEKIIIWDVATRTPKRIIREESKHLGGRTHGLAISPDNRLVASGTFGAGTNKIHLWNIETGEPVFSQEDAHADSVIAVRFSPDASLIATGSGDATVRIWDATSGKHLRLLDKGSGWVRYVEFFPDGRLLALGRETHSRDKPKFEGELKICDVASGEIVHHFPVSDRVMCGAISPKGDLLAAGIGLGMSFMPGESSECKVLAWDIASGDKVAEFAGHSSRIEQVMFPSNSELLSASEDQTIKRWKLQNGKEIESWNLNSEGGRRRRAWPHIFPDATRVVLRELDRVDRGVSRGRLTVQEIRGAKVVWEQKFNDTWPWAFAVSSHGNYIAAFLTKLSHSKATNRIAIFAADDGEEVLSFELEDGAVRSLAFSPDCKRLVTGMEAGDALVWDISDAHKSITDAVQ